MAATAEMAASGHPSAAAAVAAAADAPPLRPVTMTSKEWIVPPRPKPGRKPAIDTPPTKRKTQNRAAQRAFRERRAARVGELEEALEDQREQHDREAVEMQDRIRQLEAGTRELQARCSWLEDLIEKERKERWEGDAEAARVQMRAPKEWQQPQHHRHEKPSSQNTSFSSAGTSTDSQAIELPGLAPAVQSPALSKAQSDPLSTGNIISPLTGGSCGACTTDGPCACAQVGLQVAVGCGRCSLETECECLEETVQAMTAAAVLAEAMPNNPPVPSDLKRPLSRMSASSPGPEGKRPRPSADSALAPGNTSHTWLETDFTALYEASKKRGYASSSVVLPRPSKSQPQQQQGSAHTEPPQPQLQTQPIMLSMEPKDSCGFCSSGSYCLCAEAAAAETAETAEASFAPISLPQTVPLPASRTRAQQQTPPPSADDVVMTPPAPMEITATGAVKLPGLPFLHTSAPAGPDVRPLPWGASASRPGGGGGCGPNGPGACAQCLEDPKSGLFCRSLVANFARNGSSTSSRPIEEAGGKCCGGTADGAGCCKTLPAANSNNTSKNYHARPSLSLPCAEAYKTLSSHRHFDRAADEIGTWLPKLRAVPVLLPSLQNGDKQHDLGSAESSRHDYPQKPHHYAQQQQQQFQQGGGGGGGGGGEQDFFPGGMFPSGYAPIEVEAASIMTVLKEFDVRFGRGK